MKVNWMLTGFVIGDFSFLDEFLIRVSRFGFSE